MLEQELKRVGDVHYGNKGGVELSSGAGVDRIHKTF